MTQKKSKKTMKTKRKDKIHMAIEDLMVLNIIESLDQDHTELILTRVKELRGF